VCCEGVSLSCGATRHLLFLAFFWLTVTAGLGTSQAQTAHPQAPHAQAPSSPPASDDVNETTVGIISGTVTGTYVQFASDLTNVLDTPGKLRVLAILGKGSEQNIADILKLRGVDIGIVQSDVLAYVKKQGTFPDVENKLQYVTKLYNEEFHIVAGPDVANLEDLSGKKVNFGPKGSGISITTSTVFDLLKIPVEATYDDPSVALDKLKQGQIAASAGVYGKPAKIYESIKPDDNIHFVPVPATIDLSKVYYPSSLSNKDYPNLIGANDTVETVAVGAVMVVFSWEPNSWRYRKVARFVDMFFSSLDQLQKPPRHPKWQEVNLGAKIPGWVRFPAAEEWLKRAYTPAKTAAQLPPDSDLAAFRRFLAETASTQKSDLANEEARQKLFESFENWKKKQSSAR
jgi:TRAP transporter TAXI family solute receptor